MTILMHDSLGYYNLVDYDNKRSTDWQSFIPTAENFRNDTLDSWFSSKLPPLNRIEHLQKVDGYTIVSIDDIPFAEWSAQHPEYFI